MWLTSTARTWLANSRARSPGRTTCHLRARLGPTSEHRVLTGGRLASAAVPPAVPTQPRKRNRESRRSCVTAVEDRHKCRAAAATYWERPTHHMVVSARIHLGGDDLACHLPPGAGGSCLACAARPRRARYPVFFEGDSNAWTPVQFPTLSKQHEPTSTLCASVDGTDQDRSRKGLPLTFRTRDSNTGFSLEIVCPTPRVPNGGRT
jgi:hypothetical protein